LQGPSGTVDSGYEPWHEASPKETCLPRNCTPELVWASQLASVAGAVATTRRDLERGLARLDKLISWAQEHVVGIERNEATTRLHLIDELLMNVLTWPRAQVRAEEPTLSTGRA
jgi:hypothetical protein